MARAISHYPTHRVERHEPALHDPLLVTGLALLVAALLLLIVFAERIAQTGVP